MNAVSKAPPVPKVLVVLTVLPVTMVLRLVRGLGSATPGGDCPGDGWLLGCRCKGGGWVWLHPLSLRLVLKPGRNVLCRGSVGFSLTPVFFLSCPG